MTAVSVLEIQRPALYPVVVRQMSLERQTAVVFDFAGICTRDRLPMLAELLERSLDEIIIVEVPEFHAGDFIRDPVAYSTNVFQHLGVGEYVEMEPFMTCPLNGVYSAQMTMGLCRFFTDVITIIRWVPVRSVLELLR